MYLLLIIVTFLFTVVLLQNMIIKRQIKQTNEHLKLVVLELSTTNTKKITNNREINALLQTINKLLAKNRQIQIKNRERSKQYQKMIAAIAHDIKTPATSILGYLELADTSINIEKRKQYLLIVKKRLEAMNLLIDNFFLLALARDGSYPYKMEVVNPKQMVQEQLSLYYDMLEENFAEINVALDEKSIYTKLDKKAFLRIINNIIVNSVKHGLNVLEVRERRIRKYYYLIIKNDIKTLATSESSGIGLQVINTFAHDLNIKVNITKTNKEFVIELALKILSIEGNNKKEADN